MKINWKVRLRNPVFWATFIPALVSFVYTVLGCFGVVPTVSEEMVINIISAGISALAAIGVLVDPTTKGTGDSERAMHYEFPN